MPSQANFPSQDPTSSGPVLVTEKQDKPGSRLQRLKPWLETLQAVLTIIGFFAGFYWFLEQRFNKPNVKLEQTITQRGVAGDPASILITLDVRATNIGKVKVDLGLGQAKLLQINPTVNDPKDAPHMEYALKKITLEPGESDQALFQTVRLPSTVNTLQVSTHYAVPGTKNYWTYLSAVDIDRPNPKKPAQATASSAK